MKSCVRNTINLSCAKLLLTCVISEEDTFLLLSKGDLKAETESEIVAAQDQDLNTKYYATNILHTRADSKCRLCQNLMRQ